VPGGRLVAARYLLALLALIGSAACGDGGSDRRAARPAQASAPGTASGAASTGTHPIEAFLRAGLSHDEQRDLEASITERRAARLDECLAAAAVDPAVLDMAAPPPPARTEQIDDPDEYIRAHGYGYAASLRPPDVVDPPAAPDPGAATPGPEELRRAVEGSKRCSTELQREIPDLTLGSLPADLAGPLDELRATIRTDPRVTEAEGGWSACMRDAGHHFADRAALHDELRRRLAPLQDAADAAYDGTTFPRLAPADQQRLDDLQRYELEVAAADIPCKEPVDAVTRTVRDEHETAFVETHEAELAAHRDRIRG
jgi:hypothetical protein